MNRLNILSYCLLFWATQAVSEVVETDEGTFIERIAYSQPTRINIPVGKERSITFQNPVSVGVRPNDFSTLRVMTVANTSYWKVLNNITLPVRLKVTDKKTGEIFIFDIGSETDGSDSLPVEVISTKMNAKSPSGEPSQTSTANIAVARDPYVAITRHVAQNYYAPSRLVESLPGASQYPAHVSRLEGFISGANVTTSIDSAWHYKGIYLTAIEVVNKSQFPLYLNFDPRYEKEYGLLIMRSGYLSVTANDFSLAREGRQRSSTLLYVLSDSPLIDLLFSNVLILSGRGN